MSKTAIKRKFGGKDRWFDLSGHNLVSAETQCGAGIQYVLAVLTAAALSQAGIRAAEVQELAWRYRTAFARTVILWGLVGGRLNLVEADRLLAEHFDSAPAETHVMLAAEIAAAAVHGADALKGDAAASLPGG